MKDLRIVIVSWNVRDLLERCLSSLPAACDGLDWDCMVVDNDSSDGSVELIERFSRQDDRIDVIANKTNHGFAFACNQGATRHDARYVLLLNPDTECPAGSLKSLVGAADQHPEAGILGPKLVYPDGRYQESVRRFPTLLDQTLILLKLHHVCPRQACLARYFYRDLDKDKAQEVDQVMGACFLVRAQCWDRMKGMDQRYFVWFEEVDACRRATKDGWNVRYEPSVTVVHHGGQSFDQVFSATKQGYYDDSLRKYMRKWQGWAAWAWFSALHPVSLALAAIIGWFREPRAATKRFICKPCVSWLSVFLIAEVASAVSYDKPVWSAIFCTAIALGTMILAYKRPALALALAAAEAMVGGFGYLFSWPAAWLVRGISLRMAMMAGFFLGWGLNAMRARVWRYWRLGELAILQVWVFVAGMVLGGLLRGWQLGQPFIYQDANSWFFLLYLIPVLDVAHRQGAELKRHVSDMAKVGLAWLAAKMLAVFYVFAHGLGASDWLYAWIRDTRVGEITQINISAYRIFFQSAVFSALALPGLLAARLETKAWKKMEVILPVTALITLILGLSRSLWVGADLGMSAVLVLFAVKAWRERSSLKTAAWTAVRAMLAMGIASLAALAIILFVWRLPIPQSPSGSIWEMFGGRMTVSDPAAASRWALLPAMLEDIKDNPILGHGFGSTVTYKSQDPRVLLTHPDGMQTTYAFEWGWIALWIKLGIFGVIIMGWLLASIAWRTWKSEYAWWIRVGVVAGTIALAAIHFFTPYLDHPLGFAWILGIEGMLAIKREEQTPHGK